MESPQQQELVDAPRERLDVDESTIWFISQTYIQMEIPSALT